MMPWALLLMSGSTTAALNLRPQYHFTRAKNHMNDPNGLMWLPKNPDSAFPEYEYVCVIALRMDPPVCWEGETCPGAF
jgi:hypothetical protein